MLPVVRVEISGWGTLPLLSQLAFGMTVRQHGGRWLGTGCGYFLDPSRAAECADHVTSELHRTVRVIPWREPDDEPDGDIQVSTRAACASR